MDFKKAKEIVERAKESAPNQQAHQLAESFEEFILLYEARKEVKTPLDWALYAKKLQECRSSMLAHLEKTAASLGLSVTQMQAYFENPKNFSQSQWIEMQTMREEVLHEKQGPVAVSRKKPRINKNIRI
jgi:hypothetical protein